MSDRKKETQPAIVSVAVTTLFAAPVLGCGTAHPVPEPPPAQTVTAENRAVQPAPAATAITPASSAPAKSVPPEEDAGPVYNPKGVRG